MKSKYEGLWWLPDAEDDHIVGTLRFIHSKKPRLDLIGIFNEYEANLYNKERDINIINGLSSKGEKITLFNCIPTMTSYSSLVTSSYLCHLIFIGHHFRNINDIKFKQVYVNYSNLNEWTNLNGFNISVGPNLEADIKYTKPNSKRFKINDELDLIIAFEQKGPNLKAVQSEIDIKQISYLGFEFSEERAFQDYKNMIYNIQNFISLGVGEPVYPLIIEGYRNSKDRGAIEIYYPLINTPKGSRNLLPFEMLFTYKEIEDNLEIYSNNWISKADKMQPIYNLYFGTLYSPFMYLEHKFLSLVQAVESYHRRFIINADMDNRKHEERLDRILESSPKEYRRWLNYKLKYSNEPHLEKRLHEIYSLYQTILDDFIPNSNEFIQDIVTTRNYLTHYDPSLRDRALKGKELHPIVQKLKLIIQILLLTEVGFNKEHIKNIFGKYRIKSQYIGNGEHQFI